VSDKAIAEILDRYGEDPRTATWRVQGSVVIYHKALERIAAQAQIAFDRPETIRAERDEAVILVSGRLGDKSEWSYGEALVGVNYRVSGKQAAYVYAMAEKRAKDRVILKLIGLHGMLYSEEEADAFKADRPANDLSTSQSSGPDEPTNDDLDARVLVDEIKAQIDKAKSIVAVTDYMLAQAGVLERLPWGLRDNVRNYAKERLIALGWSSDRARR
jgi:hypothetical protein